MYIKYARDIATVTLMFITAKMLRKLYTAYIYSSLSPLFLPLNRFLLCPHHIKTTLAAQTAVH